MQTTLLWTRERRTGWRCSLRGAVRGSRDYTGLDYRHPTFVLQNARPGFVPQSFCFHLTPRGRVLDAGVSSIGYGTCGLQSRRAKWDANECLRRRRVKHFSGIEKLHRISLVLGRCVFCLSAVTTTVLTSLEERTNRHRIQGRRRMVTRAMTVTF